MKLALAVLPLALAAPASGTQAESDVWESEEHGFRIARPGEGWAFQERRSSSGLVLAVHPTDGARYVALHVEVIPCPPGTAPSEVLRLMNEALECFDWFTDVESSASSLGGRPAVGHRARYRSESGRFFEVRQDYRVEEGLVYVVHASAPQEDWPRYEPEFARIFESFEMLPPSPEWRELRHLRSLASRLGSELDWEQCWSAASARARRTARPILAHVHPGDRGSRFVLSPAVPVFADLDVIELIEARFVPWRFHDEDRAPLEDPATFGIGFYATNDAILIVTPDGEVVAQTEMTHPTIVYEFLRKVVDDATAAERHAETPRLPTSLRIERARERARRGELERALAYLAGLESAEARLLEAHVLRRLRRGDEALDAFRQAQAAGADPYEVATGSALTHLRMGRAGRALAALRPHLDGSAEHTEAAFWSGRIALRSGETDAMWDRWKALVADHESDRWAWLAAAYCSRSVDPTHLAHGLEWPSERVFEDLRWRPYAPAPSSELADVERIAVAYLLDGQDTSGAWLAAGPWTIAVTAICGSAMLARPENEACVEAAQRARAYLLGAYAGTAHLDAAHRRADLSIWNALWTIRFLTDCLTAGVGDDATSHRVAEGLGRSIADQQRESGGWGYDGHPSATGGDPSTRSMSFLTAAVVATLVRARDAGIPVPGAELRAAADCLERMRHEEGYFEYIGDADESPEREARASEAAGRAPLCELALLRSGRSDPERVARALSLFDEHAAVLANELGKALFHAGPEAQSSHYLLFDYAFAALALRELPEERRGPLRARLIELVLDARAEEGCFRDSPTFGWSYGTGMALLALDALGAGE